MADVERRTKRYPTDLTDAEWVVIQPLLPKPPKRGRKPGVDMREVLNAIRYMARSGGGWRMLPIHFGPWQTIYWWFRRFVRRLLFRTIHDIALMLDRERVGREASPSGGVLDSQTVKAPSAEKRGFDAAKKIVGRNRIVRDTVRGVLEAEVGAVTGGRRFDSIRANIETAYSALRTPATGKSRGVLAAAEAGVTGATSARQQAENTLREYEQLLTDLVTAKARLRIVERDIVDPKTAEHRKKLEEDQKVAETVSLRWSAAEAQYGRADEIAKTAVSRIERLETAERRVVRAKSELEAKQTTRDEVKSRSDTASEEEKTRRREVEVARSEREKRDAYLSAARLRARAFSTAAGARRAINTRKALSDLEKRERVLLDEAAATIEKKDLDDLAQLERTEIEARARFEAGTVKVHVELADGVTLRVDGTASTASSIDVLAATRFQIGDAGSLLVQPPYGSGRSIQADLAAARDSLDASLRSLGIESHSAAVGRNERAAAAARELEALRAQIAAACPGDPTIGLAPGADALRAYVAGLDDTVGDIVAPADDVEALERELAIAKLAEVAAMGKHEDCRGALLKAESALATGVAELASATREFETAAENLRLVVADGDRAALDATLADALRDRTAAFEALEAAREGAKAFDLDRIRRSLANLDRAATRAGEERLELTGRIASLESTITREGASGPAGRVAETREAEQAAIAVCDRLRREADTLELLRQTLADAANEASRTFLAPVTKRAARYIEQLLPGCELSFDEDLGLSGVTRAGIDEACGILSRGTQEQLAILTRLAFADLLLEDGAPISLILDDPLVYSDDARLEVMTDMLQEASERMQVILLTCRSKAFRHVDANRIVLR